MRKRLLLAGGGHAHLLTLSRLDCFRALGIAVTCVAPGPHLAYSGMGPGMLAGRYAPEELRFDIKAMLLDGRERRKDSRRPSPLAGPIVPSSRAGSEEGHEHAFVQGRLATILPDQKRIVLEDGRELGYDVLSVALGSEIRPDFPVAGEGVYPVKPIENLLAAREAIASRVGTGEVARVLVAGGGAAAFEVAGNVLGLLAGLGVRVPQVTVAAGHGLLPGWPGRAGRLATASLTKRGARVVYDRVTGFAQSKVTLASGATLTCDVLLVATGTRPPGLLRACGLALTPDGGLTVNTFLQSPLFPDIFGGGDCVWFAPKPLPRAGVYAVRQGPVLCANLLARLTGRELSPFRKTDANFLAILNCGDGRAILRKGPFVFEGPWCMTLKNRIDTRFMRSFPLRHPSRAPDRPA